MQLADFRSEFVSEFTDIGVDIESEWTVKVDTQFLAL